MAGMKEIKEDLVKKTVGYKEGAIAGALIGVVIAASMKKKIMLGALIGLMAGGYIGHLIKGKEENTNKFVKQ